MENRDRERPRSTSKLTPRSALALAALAAGACRHNLDFLPTSDAATLDARSPLDARAPDANAPQAITQSVGRAGATISLDGVTLTIPPGALESTVAITIRVVNAPPPTAIELYSPQYRFEPEGLLFNVPASVAMRFRGDATRAQLFWTRLGSTTEFDALTSRTSGAVTTANIEHFSRGFVGARIALGLDAGAQPDAQPCAAGLTNCAGTCVDLLRDAANCGRCGTSCSGSSCVEGTCTAAPRATSVAVGAHYVCAVMDDRSVRCWGQTPWTSSGPADRCLAFGADRPCWLRPRVVPALTNVAQMSLTTSHGCAVRANGTALCWGDNAEGQLGDGTTTSGGPSAVTLTGITQLEVADEANTAWSEFTCATAALGRVLCWGGNAYGQFGTGTFVRGATPTPTAATGVTGARQVTTGRGFTCALMGDSTVRCWGRNDARTLGSASAETCLGPACTTTPTLVPSLGAVAEVQAGAYHVCARMIDGTVRCWGSSGSGQLGNGSTTFSVTPVAVTGLSNVVSIATGYEFTCALRSDGSVWCWGKNDRGQLGNGGTANSPVPVQVVGVTQATRIAAGGYTFLDAANACAVRQDGSVWCWGTNLFGQLGVGSADPNGAPSLPIAARW